MIRVDQTSDFNDEDEALRPIFGQYQMVSPGNHYTQVNGQYWLAYCGKNEGNGQ